MYGKIFESMYKGTLYGQWEAIITFQQLIVLADSDGVVDMTPPAIAAITSIPLEHIENGLEQLQDVDKYSRSTKESGRRIILIDEDRPWGWVIVNHKYYRNLANKEDKKQKDKTRIAEKRDKEKVNEINDVATCSGVSQKVANVAYTNTNTNKRKESKKKSRFAPPSLEELNLFINENQYTINSNDFINFYESKGWMVGKTKMKDWKASVRLWQSRNEGSISTASEKQVGGLKEFRA